MTAGHVAFGYHLWLVPEGDALHRLQGVVDRLAEEYDGPVFTPHITLLSGLAADEASLIETNRRLAAGLEPFNLDLTVPEAGTTFFQCIYMRVAENPLLSRVRQVAGEAFALCFSLPALPPLRGVLPVRFLYHALCVTIFLGLLRRYLVEGD